VTSAEENEATARRWHDEVINEGDLAVIDEIVASDIVHHTIERVFTDGDNVIIRWQAEGTNEGEFQGYAPTGKWVTWSGINIFRIECGLIAKSGLRSMVWAGCGSSGRSALRRRNVTTAVNALVP
jgi:predicted ester cyclase